MARKLIFYLLAMLVLTISGCTRPAADTPGGGTAEVYRSAPGSVGFDITTLNDQNGTLRLEAKYPARGRLAKFIIEFEPAGEGQQESEMFVNLNREIAKGQFSIKDPEYGDRALKQLATVL